MSKIFVVVVFPLMVLSAAVFGTAVRTIELVDQNSVISDAGLMTLEEWDRPHKARGDQASMGRVQTDNWQRQPYEDFTQVSDLLNKENGSMRFIINTVFKDEPIKIAFSLTSIFDGMPVVKISDLAITKDDGGRSIEIKFIAYFVPELSHKTLSSLSQAMCFDRSMVVYPLVDEGKVKKYNLNPYSNVLNIFNLAVAAHQISSYHQ